ncbi:hypothetical protein A2662_04400 [Candidatus Giovannonibacteria bacterium RIFCSPHIGHO2_01_FULL_45_33]|uniref:Uncharacterized protein n=1 Tax=Candidatus Giovannonibacteria bacterium RIFCSPLOWO2_01_FULL_45_34 TaxID=1798351 RepID=A0A1F5X0E7_9BACT|nr:MAG: hypothetical protein A2662_04400 [Candidatus Giovannonibacteria bacterium RIFCSPHIGHO2_01_FULL_45_33]OGF81365.1 MAG: hypothetical protein A2930_00625 [Candidatus Giovannonibacteria bacterium RIFCSPLOWO2_01_FULL_45_34]
MIYWAIAKSEKYPDVYVEKIDAKNDDEADKKAFEWNRDHNGFRYTYLVAKEILTDAEIVERFSKKYWQEGIVSIGMQRSAKSIRVVVRIPKMKEVKFSKKTFLGFKINIVETTDAPARLLAR